jgi:dTDP-4-amino-4,6-dideoxygalactose transaminase
MRKLELVDLRALHAELGSEVETAVLRVVRDGQYIGGPEVSRFEDAFAAYLGVRHVIAVGNGTDALQLALLAVGIQADDEVLVPANTFIATAEAVTAIGAIPRFCDVHADTGLIDLASAEERLTERTTGIIPVHLYGRMVDMDAMMRFAASASLKVVEDAAQAHGACRGGRPAGTVGDAGCFSFYPGKNLGAVGDAGAVVTEDDATADLVRLYRDHGRRRRDEHEVVGRNSRMDAVQAAVLETKLPHLDRWTAARTRVAQQYRASLGAFLDWVAEAAEAEVHHLFPIMVCDRDEVRAQLGELSISTGIHYRVPLPNTRAFAWSLDACPVADQRARSQMSLPIHPYLSNDDVEYITTAVLSVASPERAGALR